MGGFDLSVGSVQVLTAIVVASLLSVIDPALAIVGALLTGLALGLLNGTLISKLQASCICSDVRDDEYRPRRRAASYPGTIGDGH